MQLGGTRGGAARVGAGKGVVEARRELGGGT